MVALLVAALCGLSAALLVGCTAYLDHRERSQRTRLWVAVEGSGWVEVPGVRNVSFRPGDDVVTSFVPARRAVHALAAVVDMDGPLDRAVARAEAAEAREQQLREALTKACAWLDRIIDHYDPEDTEGGRADVAEWRALASETATQEGGEEK